MKPMFHYWVRGSDYAELARLSIRSVWRVYGAESRISVSTDSPEHFDHARFGEHAEGWLGLEVHRIRRREPPMIENLAVQYERLAGSDCDANVFLDGDVVLLRGLPLPTFGGAHIVATWRDHDSVNEDGSKNLGAAATMPYNYGVLMALRSPAAIEAFLWMRERIKAMNPSLQGWYGNQMALAELLGPKLREAPEDREIPWAPEREGNRIRALALPCETWNYTPESLSEDLSAKGALHFKGKRKDMMREFCARLFND